MYSSECSASHRSSSKAIPQALYLRYRKSVPLVFSLFQRYSQDQDLQNTEHCHWLSRYSSQVQELPDKIWSPFFFQWQFLCDSNAFENNGSFIRLCSNILGSDQKYKHFIEMDISLFEPSSYSELCCFVRSILNLSNVDIYGFDYYKSFKYLIYSLVKFSHVV